MCALHLQAQEREVEDKDDIFSKVRIDTIQIKATPYERVLENGVWKDEDKQIDYYNDITIYGIIKKESGQPSAMMTGPKSAVFLLPGGGYFNHTPNDVTGLLSLGVRIVSEYHANAYIVYYILPTNNDTLNLIKNSTIVINRGTNVNLNCTDLQNETGKARLEEASYKAFHDLRKVLRLEYVNKALQKDIDTNKFMMIGSSAGAILALNSLFLQAPEIPSTIIFNNSCPIGTNNLAISIDDSIINGYWPMPKMKGVVSMSGAWIYDSIKLVNLTPNSVYQTPLFLMHGTCDNLINRKVARIGFKRATPLLNPPQNVYPANRFIRGYGSEYVFNQFKNDHNSIVFGQVLNGGHAPFDNSIGWDRHNIGINDTVLMNQLRPFLNTVLKDSTNIESRAYSFSPRAQYVCNLNIDKPEDAICFQKIYNPNTNYTSVLCDNNSKQAIVQYSHSDASYSWSISSGANISFVGANSGTTIQYKRVANINKIDTLKVTITRPCAETRIFAYVVKSTNAAPFTATLTPSGWDNICATNKTATLSGVPAGTPNPVWTATGNIQIVSSSGISVTYKRTSNISSSGVLTATFTIDGCQSFFNFTVTTLPTLGNWINTFGIVSQCGSGIVTNSPSKVPDGTNATFSTIYSNAAQNGVTNLQWSSNCIVVNETQIWIGNDLREDYTITASSGCTFVQVRPQNTCGFGSWKSTGISVESCGGGGWGMMLSPNPTSTILEVMLTHEEGSKLAKTFDLQVLDVSGNVLMKSTIENGKKQLDVTQLRGGLYRILIQTDDEMLHNSFHVGR
jgi:hypothetical protein